MKEVFETPKRAILNAEFMFAEMNDSTEIEYTITFDANTEVVVFGHAYSNSTGRMFVIYSPDAKQAITVHEMFLDFISDDEEEEIIE